MYTFSQINGIKLFYIFEDGLRHVLLTHFYFIIFFTKHLFMMPHPPPSWCSSNFQFQWSDHCNTIVGHSITARIFSSMLRIRKLFCSKCIFWNLLLAMASVDIPVKQLVPCIWDWFITLMLIPKYKNSEFGHIVWFNQLSSCSHSINLVQHFLKSNICSLFIFVLCNLLHFHKFFYMIPKFGTKSTVTSSKADSSSNTFVLLICLLLHLCCFFSIPRMIISIYSIPCIFSLEKGNNFSVNDPEYPSVIMRISGVTLELVVFPASEAMHWVECLCSVFPQWAEGYSWEAPILVLRLFFCLFFYLQSFFPWHPVETRETISDFSRANSRSCSVFSVLSRSHFANVTSILKPLFCSYKSTTCQ